MSVKRKKRTKYFTTGVYAEGEKREKEKKTRIIFNYLNELGKEIEIKKNVQVDVDCLPVINT